MYKVKYDFDYCKVAGYYITKDGHRLFPEDVIKDLDRMNFLEQKIKTMKKDLKYLYDDKCKNCKDKKQGDNCNIVDCKYFPIKKLLTEY